MRLYGSNSHTSKSTRRHARANRPIGAFDAPAVPSGDTFQAIAHALVWEDGRRR
jgi:hypothetical protein